MNEGVQRRGIRAEWVFALVSILGGLIHTLSLLRWQAGDSDIAGLCCFAESISRGLNPANPYFPPGFPVVLWLAAGLGLSCFNTLALTNGIGLALAMYHAAALWRRFGAGVIPATGAALVLLMLPDLIWTFEAPHLDGLVLGLTAVFLHGAIAAWRGEATRGLTIGAALCGTLLVLFRWHIVIAVVPVLLVVALTRRTRRYALRVGVPVLLGLIAAYGSLYAATGGCETAGKLQVFTGLCYTAEDSEAVTIEMTRDYAAFAETNRDRSPVAVFGWQRLLNHTLRNYRDYLTVKATAAGLGLFLLCGLFWKRWPRGSIWVAIFAVGYSLAISPSYFVHRASILVEWCGVVLIGAAMAGVWPRLNRWARLAAMLAGVLVLGYGVRTAIQAFPPAVQRRVDVIGTQVDLAAYAPREVAGWNVYSYSLVNPPFNLPSASLNRLWLDDPALADLTAEYPRYTVADVTAEDSPVRLLIINPREKWPEITTIRDWARSRGWECREIPGRYEIWLRPDHVPPATPPATP